MNGITDTAGNDLTYVYFLLTEGQTGAAFVARCPGGEGRFLTAADDDRLRIQGRRSGTADAFQDLADDPLELDWADPADVDVRAVAGAVDVLERPAVRVRVTRNP